MTGGESALSMTGFRVLNRLSYLDSVSKDVPALLSILRMSTKYDVSRLRKRVIKTLEAHYPQDPLRSPWSPVSLYPSIFPSSVQSALAIAAANSARQAEALTLLPAALFACCSVDPDFLVGPEHPDVHVGLSPENLFTVLKGRNDIILFTRRHIFGFAFTPRDVPDCRTPSECRRVRAEWAEYTDKHHPDGWTNPLSPGTFISTLSRVACMKCTDEAKRSFERGQRELWNDLPRIFGLPAWDKLEQMSTMDEENC